MDIRKTSTSLLLALALSGIQAPLTSTVAIAQQAEAPQLTCDVLQRMPLELRVNDNENNKRSGSLASAVNTVKDHFSRCGDTPVSAVILLKDGNHVLPSDFEFHNTAGRLTIRPVDGAKAVSLSLPNSRQFLTTRAIDLTISDVSINFQDKLFEANSSVRLDGVKLQSNDGVAITAGSDLTDAHRISSNKVELTDTSLLDLADKSAQVEIRTLRTTRTKALTRPVINLPAIAADKKVGASNVIISGADFTFNQPRGPQAVLHIGRPNVTVRELRHADTGADATSITLQNTSQASQPNDEHQLHNISITRSDFQVANAIREIKAVDGTEALITARPAVDFSQNNLFVHHLRGADPNKQPVSTVFPVGNTASPKEAFNASCNYWGDDLRFRSQIQAVGLNRVLVAPDNVLDSKGFATWPCVDRPFLGIIENNAQRNPQTNPGGSGGAPSNPDTRIQNEEGRISGPTRIETSVAASQDLYPKGADTVILARADVAADSVSAIPLAQELKAPVLLTMRDGLHPTVANEIKRLMPNGGRVIIMGGDQALSQKVAEDVAKVGGKVERIAGANRAATAVATAAQLQRMGKATQVLLADGNDWQPDLIAGPVAAKVDGVTLLTSGSTVAPETAAFLNANGSLKVTAVGDGAAKSGAASTVITGTDGADLSLKVAQAFFNGPRALGFATTADFADPLVGGNHIAHHQGPLLLVNQTASQATLDWAKNTKTVQDVFIYGGDARISKAEADRINSVKVAKPAS